MKRACTAFIYLLSDAVFAAISLYSALLLRFDFIVPAKTYADLTIYFPVMISAFLFSSYILGCYEGIVRYTGFSELLRQLSAVFMTSAFFLLVQGSGMINIPVSTVFIAAPLLFILSGGSRALPRIISRFYFVFDKNRKKTRRAIIIGAGACGAMFIKRLKENGKDGYYPVACLDDNLQKKGLRICGVRIMGTTDEIAKTARKAKAEEILIAIPSADTKAIRAIYEKCIPTGLPVRLFQRVVDIEDFMRGKRSALREISIEDLLCRDSVRTDTSAAKAYINGKTVLVTGGAGSIGSELCRQALKNGCRQLIVFDICENGLYQLNEELKASFPQERYKLILGSVRDKTRIFGVFEKYRPQLVFHAAAHKHVPLSEINPFEVVKNNIFGTKNVIDASIKFGASKFLLISTDKAVNPTNIMGASKRIAEMLVQSESYTGIEMAAVRFGNVLGSNGSVVPLFKRQIAEGGPVTVTHPDMKRYFMTIQEAVSLVQTAAAIAGGGEIFVLNMGEPVKIADMAKDLIRLFGYEPGRDIEIRFTGLRPGEKLFEELSLDSESVSTTGHSKIFVMQPSNIDQLKLRRDLTAISTCLKEETDAGKIRNLVFDTIKEEPVFAGASSLKA
ncbi:MAG: nucleoside-diphosphate sugar epimerase/dehydratase [Bacillota bacterium]|nr:nucleoside-diphosphate sugar epimerase/dehydratase [Bacillota bacterium]